ncbi:hypothetical protein [Labrys neptuniae]
MIAESFFHPRRPVSVIAIGDSGEALLLRAILESLDAAVTLHLPGTPGDFLLCLGQGTRAGDLVVLSGHGDANGLVFGEFDPTIDTTCLVEGSLPPGRLAGHVNLPGRCVISTACLTGGEAFAEAFLAGGARAYLAPADYPDGADVPLFLHHFCHGLLQRGQTLRAAFEQANALFQSGSSRFALFERSGHSVAGNGPEPAR